MRKREAALIVTFATATQAMEMERICAEQRVPGRLIPVPQEIASGCGLAWKAPPEERERIARALADARLPWAEMRVVEI